MITAADEVFIDFSTSCTRDVAVAKLLGWMQGPMRRKWIDVTTDGISEDQLPYLHRMDAPIKDQLLELRVVAQQKLYRAYEEDDQLSTDKSRKMLSDAADEVEGNSQKIYLAAQYFRDIDDELANPENPQLRIDLVATQAPDDPYITLNSLTRWAKSKYDISIFDGGLGITSDGHLAGTVKTGHVDVDQVKSDVVAAKRQKEKFSEGSKAEVSLLVTFAFLVDAFIAQVRNSKDDAQIEKFLKGKDDENINVSAIARHLEDLMAKANGKKFLDDQQFKSIDNRIKAASKAKIDALPKR